MILENNISIQNYILFLKKRPLIDYFPSHLIGQVI